MIKTLYKISVFPLLRADVVWNLKGCTG